MANRFYNPREQYVDSSGNPYSGGTLTFYATGTTTPLDTYSDSTLSTPNANPLTLNSAGRPSTDIFLSDAAYKVVLKDSSGSTIWTADPCSTSDFTAYGQFYTYAGDPNGNVAGTEGSGTVPADVVWDRTNNILYVCTTTGAAASAVWTAVNASSTTQVVTPPQGYLTLTSATPIITGDVSAATSVYYTPFVGELVPIYNGTATIPTEFSELTLSLVASHLASTIYDVFVFSNSGVVTLVTGPAWSTSTAGSGARGTGASTTELTRLNGYWVNKVQITGRNGSTTYTIPANRATYVGSLFMDGSNGQISCHRTWGQSRKWGVWNAYNRQHILMKAGDSTASWSYSTNTVRASNNASANSISVFTGLSEEAFDLQFSQRITIASSTAGMLEIGVGWNSTSAVSGMRGTLRTANGSATSIQASGSVTARYVNAPALGVNTVTSLEVAPNSGSTNDFLGTETNMMLTASYFG
jgi:hypothetical protein